MKTKMKPRERRTQLRWTFVWWCWRFESSANGDDILHFIRCCCCFLPSSKSWIRDRWALVEQMRWQQLCCACFSASAKQQWAPTIMPCKPSYQQKTQLSIVASFCSRCHGHHRSHHLFTFIYITTCQQNWESYYSLAAVACCWCCLSPSSSPRVHVWHRL